MSKSAGNSYAKFLEIVVREVFKLSEKDIQKIINMDYELKISVVEKKRASDAKADISDKDIAQILDYLNIIQNRESALVELSSLTKKNLEMIARKLDVAIQKSDKVEAIRLKIVEATVGARLRSSAIHGTQT